MSDKYKNLKVKELQEILQKSGLPHTGKKEELIERLVKHDETKALELESLEAEFGNLEEFDESKLNLDELADPELKSLQPESKVTNGKRTNSNNNTSTSTTNTTTSSIPANTAISTKPTTNTTTNTDSIATTTTTTTTSTENTPKDDAPTSQPVTKEGSGFKFTPVVFDKAPSTNKETSSKPMTDAERKLERAKRFGVQVNEKTKQEIRAARFGTQKSTPAAATPTATTKSPMTVKPAKKGLDPEVLKKRAERFGLTDKKPTMGLSVEEEEKKRKRAERFGADVNKKQKN